MKRWRRQRRSILAKTQSYFPLARAEGESAAPRQGRQRPKVSHTDINRYFTILFHLARTHLAIFYSMRAHGPQSKLAPFVPSATASIVLGLAQVLRFKQTFIYKRCIRCELPAAECVCKGRRGERGWPECDLMSLKCTSPCCRRSHRKVPTAMVVEW